MRSHDELRELIPAYALGALEDDDRLAVERHLDDCAECRGALSEDLRTLEHLAETVEPVEPSEMTGRRLMKRIAKQPATGRPLLWQAAAGIAAAALAWSLWQQADLHREIARLAADRSRFETELAEIRVELATSRERLDRAVLANRIVASPERRSVRLAGLEGAPGASGETFVDRGRGQAVFFASDLPPLEPDRTYQLWYIADGRPVDAGIFDPDDRGETMIVVDRVPDPAAIQAWAVTVEPAGGVPQPTGPMVLKS